MASSNASSNSTRTVVLIGRTGSGKSACANTLANQDDAFKESEGSISETKFVTAKKFVVDMFGKQYELVIVDTIGLGDTKLSPDEVLQRLAAACNECCDGINAVFFVTGGRITEEEVRAWEIMWQVLFGTEVLDYTAMVRTKFVNFRDPIKIKEDRLKLEKENGAAAKRMLPYINTFLYVDNPPLEYGELSKGSREDSRDVLLNYLILTREDVFKPPVMRDVKQRISKNANIHKQAISKTELWEAQLQLASQVEKLQIEKELRTIAEEKEKAARAMAQEMEAIIDRKAKEKGVTERVMAAVGGAVDTVGSYVVETAKNQCSVM